MARKVNRLPAVTATASVIAADASATASRRADRVQVLEPWVLLFCPVHRTRVGARPLNECDTARTIEGLAGLALTHDRGERRLAAVLAGVFGCIAVLAAIDLTGDAGGAATLRHLVVEGTLFLLGLGGFTWMAGRLRVLTGETRNLAEHAEDLAHRLDASNREAARWHQEAADLIAGLSAAIDRQLDQWGLSPAEKEVALLLLKGLSHKEIGGVRKVGEATVRQQARALYQKAGLGGRHDLAAFFLEDLLDARAVASPEGPAGVPMPPSARRRT